MDDHQPGCRVVGNVPGVLRAYVNPGERAAGPQLVLGQAPGDLCADVVGAVAEPVGVVPAAARCEDDR